MIEPSILMITKLVLVYELSIRADELKRQKRLDHIIKGHLKHFGFLRLVGCLDTFGYRS